MNIKILAQNIVNNPSDFTAEQIEKYFEDYAELRLSAVSSSLLFSQKDIEIYISKNESIKQELAEVSVAIQTLAGQLREVRQKLGLESSGDGAPSIDALRQREQNLKQEKIVIPFQLLKKDSLNQLLFCCSTGREYRIFSPAAGIDIKARVDIRNNRRDADPDTFAGEIHLYPVLDK
jgi:hypothetical protein